MPWSVLPRTYAGTGDLPFQTLGLRRRVDCGLRAGSRGAAVADAGTPAEVRSFHPSRPGPEEAATRDGCQRTNRIQHSRVSTTIQCSRSHFNFTHVAKDIYV